MQIKEFDALPSSYSHPLSRLYLLRMFNARQHIPLEVSSLVNALHANNTSGSAELALMAAETLRLFARRAKVRSASEFRSQLKVVAQHLVQAQPEMAAIFTITNRVVREANDRRSLPDLRKHVGSICEKFMGDLKTSSSRIAKNASRVIKKGAAVITYSRSSTVEAALLAAHRKGKRFEVICSESRPMLEGITLAKRLSKAGIHVTLVTDAALLTLLPRADVIIVGADAVSVEGVVNKIGTSSLAERAKALRIPFYVLCGSEKFLAAGSSAAFQLQDDNPEVTAHSLRKLSNAKEYFDLSPLEFITAIVSEEGLFPPAKLRERLTSA